MFLVVFYQGKNNVFTFFYTVVSKPLWIAKSKQPILNETTICDYLLDSCDNGTSLATTAADLISGNRASKLANNMFVFLIQGKWIIFYVVFRFYDRKRSSGSDVQQ